MSRTRTLCNDDQAVDASERKKTEGGAALIASYARHLPCKPGVYRTLAENGEPLYIGKARNLRKRVQSYAQTEDQTTRIARMISLTRGLEFTTTETEAEALLLEANLIKRLKPRFNILLRDDKSFPSILLTRNHPAPRLIKHRGARSQAGEYFGPFASALAVDRTVSALQRAFMLRSCSDTVYANRSRPCILHQIKQCSAPCTGEISLEQYGLLVREASDFLSGRSQKVKSELTELMQKASKSLDFESAAVYRDRLSALHLIQGRNNPAQNIKEADIFAIQQEAGQSCIQVFFVRDSQHRGSRSYFPASSKNRTEGDVLSAFLAQFYDQHPPPCLILLSVEPTERLLLANALKIRAGHSVKIHVPGRGRKKILVQRTLENAQEALRHKLAETGSQAQLLRSLAEAFGLPHPPRRIEAYDNSHTQGNEPIGCMIVAGPQGFERSQYRKFRLKSRAAQTGDDYAMLREVLIRRFTRWKNTLNEQGNPRPPQPDLIIIDGGQGQLSCASSVLQKFSLQDTALIGIAKGSNRNAGQERFFMEMREPFMLECGCPTLYFVQRLRDEAHRFAIGAHRKRRARSLNRSVLDEIAGVGAGRRRALLRHFGSVDAVSRASVIELEAVEGVGARVARLIYDRLHDQET